MSQRVAPLHDDAHLALTKLCHENKTQEMRKKKKIGWAPRASLRMNTTSHSTNKNAYRTNKQNIFL